MDVQKINDMRQRIIKARRLQAAGEDVPEGLMPSDEELRETLIAAREGRQNAAVESSKKKAAKNGGITAETDLNELFKGL